VKGRADAFALHTRNIALVGSTPLFRKENQIVTLFIFGRRLALRALVLTAAAALAACGGGGSSDPAAPRVSLFAGSIEASGTADGQGAAARLSTPSGLAVDSAGNLFVADRNNDAIRKISPSAQVSTFAGAPGGGRADGVGLAAQFSSPAGLAIDGADNLYVLDDFPVLGFAWQTVRKVTPAAVVSHFRNGLTGPAIAADAAGNVYLSGAVKVLPDGTETFFNGPEARRSMEGIAVGKDGTVYYSTANTVRRTAPGQPEVILAGAATFGFADGAGDQARFNFFRSTLQAFGNALAVDSAGNVYLTDFGNRRVRKVTPTGVVTTVAGETEVRALTAASSPGELQPRGLALQGDKILYVSWGHAVVKIDLP
jgi:hypothetical protein